MIPKLYMLLLVIVIPSFSISEEESFKLPSKSRLIARGSGGCIVDYTRRIEVYQFGDTVIGKRNWDGKVTYHDVDAGQYTKFLQFYIKYKADLMNDYGEWASTADFAGIICVEFPTGSGIERGETGFYLGTKPIYDKKFNRLRTLMIPLITDENETESIDIKKWEETMPLDGWGKDK